MKGLGKREKLRGLFSDWNSRAARDVIRTRLAVERKLEEEGEYKPGKIGAPSRRTQIAGAA